MILQLIYWVIAHRLDIAYAIIRIIKVIVTIAWAVVTAVVILTGHFFKGMFANTHRK